MFNTIVPKEDVESMQKVLDQFKEYVENHKMTLPNLSDLDNKVHVIHSIMYLDAMKDITRGVSYMKNLLEIPEEDFVKVITDDGKHTVEEAYRRAVIESVMSMAADM